MSRWTSDAIRLLAAVNYMVFGGHVSHSDDWGKNWSEPSPGLGFAPDDGRRLARVGP